MIRRRSPLIIALATMVAASLITACGSSSGSSGSSDTTPQAAITGQVWELDTARLVRGAAGVTVTATFTTDQVSGENGCNRYSGPYTADATTGTMTIGPELISSKVACPGAQAAVERAYMAALPKAAGYETRGDRLTLVDDSGTELLRYTASNGAVAIKGSWRAASLYTGAALETPRAGSALTAKFDGNQISGNAGCNSFSGGYTTDGDTIKIGPLASTQMACADPGLTEQEQRYLTALGLAETFTVAGRRLDLFRSDGGYAVSFTR